MLYTQFRKDPKFLLRSNLKRLRLSLLMVSLASLAYLIRNGSNASMSPWLFIPMALFFYPQFGVSLVGGLLYVGLLVFQNPALFSPDGWMALTLFGAIVTAFVSAALMHNAVHFNFGKVWIAEMVGEICSFQQLDGYHEWQIIHVLFHHSFPDHPEKDPHSPRGMTFLQFMFLMKTKIGRCLEQNFFAQWGQTEEMKKLWGLSGLAILTNALLRGFFWYLLLGPVGFVTFFMVSNVMVNLLYTHFNYFTHQQNADGEYQIMDLDHGFYRIANWISFGAYAHRTHHENPKHFNPSLKMRGNEKTVRMQEAKPPAAACPVPVLLEVQSNRAI